jgi:hypothetical protein
VERRLSFLFYLLGIGNLVKEIMCQMATEEGGNRRHINCLHRLLGLLAPDFRSFVILFIYETFCFKSFSVFSFLISICCPLFCLDFYFYRFSWSNHIVFFCIFWTILYLFLYIFFLFFCLLICFPFICSCLFLFSLFQLFLFLL